MADTKWTDEQLDAINVSGRAAYVSAAAGSGKTAVLIEKLSCMLSDTKNKTPADSIVVVTFTNDAASQMKSKLDKKLNELLAAKTEELEESDDDAERASLQEETDWLSSQLSLLPSANISTIHSFCFRLIRENADLAGVDPAFAVIDAESEKTIISASMKNVLTGWTASRSSAMSELFDFFTPEKKNFDSFLRMLPALRNNVLALAFPVEFLRKTAEDYRNSPRFDDNGNIIPEGITEAYLSLVRTDMQRTVGIVRKCRDFVKKMALTSGSDADDNRKILISELDSAEAAALSLANSPERIFTDKIYFTPLEPDIGGRSDFGKTVFTECTTGKKHKAFKITAPLRRKYTELLKKYTWSVQSGKDIRPEYAFTVSEVQADMAVHARICSLLADLMSDIFDEEKRLKEERHVLGFSDAEQIACTLLCDRDDSGNIIPSDLSKLLSDKYSIVMIDEFQDSTGIQELIFRMISKDGSADKAGTNFFAVGDIKQSIYRFRCAEPRLFAADLENSVPYANDGSTDAAKILLKKNFRSSASVIGFVNTYFDAIMSDAFGGVSYGPDSRLVQGRTFAASDENTAIVNITEKYAGQCKLRRSGGDGDGKKPKLLSGDYYLAEAEAVAQIISSMLSEKDADGNPLRKPSDFCILDRRSANFGLYADALEAYGIPAEHPVSSDLMSTTEITVVMNILKAADDPYTDLDISSALMSPVFMFTADDMSRIKLMGAMDENKTDGKAAGGILRCIRLCAEADETKADELKINGTSFMTAGLILHCREFITGFDKLRSFRLTHTVFETVRFIYDSFDIPQIMSLLPEGAQKEANLRLFLSHAADYDKSGSGLSGFIRRCDSLIENGIEVNAAAPSVSDCVNIKTIHKSKGLQYPFVFLCGTKLSGSHTPPELLFSSRYGLAFNITSKYIASNGGNVASSLRYVSLPSYTLRELRSVSEDDEDIMLLYVALTRAENRLYITRIATSDADDSAEMFRILMGLDSVDFSATPSPVPQITVSGEDVSPVKYDLAQTLAENLWDKTAIVLNKFPDRLGYSTVDINGEDIALPAAAQSDGASVSAAVTNAGDIFRSQLVCKYDYTLSETASKLTVSEIAKDKSGDTVMKYVENAVKKAASDPKKMSAAARGTAVHAFMELCDMKKLFDGRNDIQAVIDEEADRLVASGLMKRVQAECIDTEMIQKLADHPLFERICSKSDEKIYRERNFLVRISDLGLDDSDLSVYNNTDGMLQGTADLLFEEDDGLVLIDYKTDRTSSEKVLKERYTRQLKLYAAVFSLILEKPVKEAYIYSFTMGTAVSIEI